MVLTMSRKDSSADGLYLIQAAGFTAAILYWANESGPLENWSAIAVIPLSADGYGTFSFKGCRAVPREVTHVVARVFCEDKEVYQDIFAPFTQEKDTVPQSKSTHLVIMSDLHLSKKSGQVKKALDYGKDADIVLLAGDLVNDGEQRQFERLQECINEELPNKAVFSVSGNHDYPLNPFPQIRDGLCDYPALQSWLFERADRLGYSVESDSCGAYAVLLGDVEIIGINAVTHWRRFIFRDGAQLKWLKKHLNDSDAKWHVIICHAPLLKHNPNRNSGEPYLSRDDQLQKILDEFRNVVFVSGHTHVSMNSPVGCVEYDEKKQHLYLNDGSIRPTTLLTDEQKFPDEFVHGNVIDLEIAGDQITVTGKSVKNGRKIARGYYQIVCCQKQSDKEFV